MISSSANTTAARGVLNAAATEAAAPTGINFFTYSLCSPSRRTSIDPMPAPTCTEGPSRPSGMPLASVMDAEATVKCHVGLIMMRLSANDRTQAVVIAVQRGLIHLKNTSEPATLYH